MTDINEIVGDEYDIGDTADIQAFIKIQRAFLDADYSRDKVTTEQYEKESRFWERIENQRLALQDVLAIPEKKAQSPYVLTQREWGYNQALSETRQAITNRLEEQQ